MKVYRKGTYKIDEKLSNPLSDINRVLKEIANDVDHICLALKGKVNFGTGDSGDRGENISGEFKEFTSPVASGTEFGVSHTLGVISIGSIILWQDKPGHLYQGPDTGTAWTTTGCYFKSSGSSVTYNAFLLKGS